MKVNVKFKLKFIKTKPTSTVSRINEEYNNKIWFKKCYWDINVIERQEIIKDIDLTEEEKLFLNDIILDIEELAVQYLNNDKVGVIPYVGNFKLNQGIRNIDKHSNEIKQAKLNGKTTEEIKDMVINFYKDGKNKEYENNKELKIYNNIKKIYKKEYNELYQTIGKSYAEMFIWTKTLLKPIEFDKYFQEAYERINGL